jgi:hypothetical protein
MTWQGACTCDETQYFAAGDLCHANGGKSAKHLNCHLALHDDIYFMAITSV